LPCCVVYVKFTISSRGVVAEDDFVPTPRIRNDLMEFDGIEVNEQ